jgi:hypothetical protein
MKFEDIQSRLVSVLTQAEIKAGTKKGQLVEAVYVQALRDNGITVPPAVDVLLMCGRSVAGYRDVGKRVQLP